MGKRVKYKIGKKDKKVKAAVRRQFRGIFHSTTRGFGFITPEGGENEEDIFVAAGNTHGAMNKDTVLGSLLVSRDGKRREGAVDKIIERGTRTVVGSYLRKKWEGWVISDDPKFDLVLIVPFDKSKGAKNGDKVVAEIRKYGNSHENPSGEITEILGNEDDPGTDILAVARSMELPMVFPEKVVLQAERVPDHVIPGDLAGREDLRGLCTVTIDGPDAKDLDDAVTISRDGDGYVLGVHIADVSNYVQEKSALDREALLRGTSVYLADRVIPMLPERLSNGICSLNAGEDRLALSALMTLDKNGAVTDHRIVESVIRVDKRMSYPEVQKVIDALNPAKKVPEDSADINNLQKSAEEENPAGTKNLQKAAEEEDPAGAGNLQKAADEENPAGTGNLQNSAETEAPHAADKEKDKDKDKEKDKDKDKDAPGASEGIDMSKIPEGYGEYSSMIALMYELSLKIRRRREKRGAIDFDFPEAKVVLDENGLPIDIVPEIATDATRIIEDFMLTANETVAEEFFRKKIPFVYRVHGDPDPEKIENILSFVRRQGLRADRMKSSIAPKEIQRLQKTIKGAPCEQLVSRLLLRSMSKARYSAECEGHFGLAAKYYCHFTSPIRRYPDLQIHRIIHEVLRERMTESRKQHYREILSDVALKSSAAERRAEETERETVKLKKAQYMIPHIGETFEGTITQITSWGVYVELPNTVEGLIRVHDLSDDYYIFDESRQEMNGRLSGRTLRIGDPIRVIMKDADLRMRTIEFELA